MILVDSSIWIDHLNVPDVELTGLLQHARALIHPFVIGEIALGALRNRAQVISRLMAIKQTVVADHADVMILIDRHSLGSAGIGYVDAHLLASTKLSEGSRLWTRDRRLSDAATRLEINHVPMH